MAHARKSMRKKSTQPRPGGRTPAATGLPKVKKARKPRKTKAAANQDALAKVVKVVARMQTKQYGNLQLQKHIYVNRTNAPVHPADSTAIQTLCAEQPICWMVQNICTKANVYQLTNDNSVSPQTYVVAPVGTWDKQKFTPAILGGATQDKFDTQVHWGNSDGGTSAPEVSTKYMLGSSTYNINLLTLGVAGFIELVLCCPRDIQRSSGASIPYNALPQSLTSFVQTCRLSELENVVSSRFYKMKVLKSHYFSNFGIQGQPPGAPATEHSIAQIYKTYGQKNWRVSIKSNSLIEVAAVSADGTIYDYEKIPMNKQSFLMVRTSVSKKALQAQNAPGTGVAGLNAFQRISVSMQRLCSFRDQLGSST